MRSVFTTREWFDLLARYGLPPDLRRTDATVGDLGLPLSNRGGRFQSLSTYYSANYGMRDDMLPSMPEALLLADWFRAQRAYLIELRPLHANTPLLPRLMNALRQRAYLCDTYHISTNWYLPCAGLSWTDYLASRPSRLVNTLRRCRKKLETGTRLRIDIITTGTGLDVALEGYRRVYAGSWKEAEPYPDFIPELCRMAASHGWLRLGVLYLDGEAAAAQIWFVKDGTASIYKLAYDSRFAKLGVGTVLTAALTEHVLEVDKVSEIDFLTGDDAYKSEWMTHSRELVGLIAFSTRSPQGLLRAGLHFGRRWLRRLLHGATAV